MVADTNANIYGSTNNADIGQSAGLSLFTQSGCVYRGVVYGGSRAGGSGVSAAIGDGVTLRASGIVQRDNQKLLAAGKGASAWLVGGGQAVGGGTLTVTATVNVLIYSGADVERVVGGGQASGSGSVAECGVTSVVVHNCTVRGDIYGGGYADNGGVSTITGSAAVHIDGTEGAVTVMGNIYGGGANPRHTTGGGSSSVKGDSLVRFSGKGADITVGTVSGDGYIAGTVQGTRRLEFYNFTGEFSGI